jgi:hypothetical protein
MDTVTTTAIEVHRGPNGVLEVLEDQPMQSLDGGAAAAGPSVNGMVMEQQQMMQQPPLYDMDLERMQTDLFKGRYLTPQDFLDDVGKMVHNADVRAHEDLDRLHKAQAMFTAAQVSIQEFDPQLRLECERMAVRERQRRDERRREKEKERGKEQNGNVPPAGARRSARNNGLQPEHPITDPVKLERRLKRQRGEEGSGLDSNGSEVENHGLPNADGGRDAKRSKIIDDDDDRDPLDTLASSRPGTEGRTHVVRFAPTMVEPMAPLIEVQEMQQPPHSFNNHFNHNQNHLPQLNQLAMPPHPSLQQNGHFPHNYIDQRFLDQMVVDESPRRTTGFDPALLNPVPPAQNLFPVSPFGQRPINGSPYTFPTMSTDPTDPFMSQPHPQHSRYAGQNGEPTMSLLQMLAKTPTPPPPQHMQAIQHMPDIPMQLNPALERQRSPLPPVASSSAPVPEAVPMPVERSPTPPLPEFHVSPSFVSDLRYLLKERTAKLTIEQLEQLRAACLGTVWRHRKDWDRDELVQALIKEVNEFVDEVLEYDSSED